jgi:membrane-bound metal-dependent hydrolase YbcI (DUF457 family)
VSWAAHDLEPYAIQRHLGTRVAIVPLLVGSYAPDLATKWLVYGVNVFGHEIKGGESEAQFHRGWPGVGFTHSLAFGVVVAGLILVLFHSRVWALSFLIGQWAHAITDVGDTVGCMLFFPFTTYHVALGAWAYAAQEGRFVDGAAYFSGPGGVIWEGFWVVVILLYWRVLTRDYFCRVVWHADATWRWLGRFLPEAAILALFRASCFYGITRWAAWMIWAHVVHDYPIDLSWGGPGWVTPARP